ncbi:hypothetical protein FCV25MIE_07830 [Fagus crenata]
MGNPNLLDLSGSDPPQIKLTENALTNSFSLEPAVMITNLPVGDVIDRNWGSSSNGVLELRDGRRITIPLSLICTMPTNGGDVEQGLPVLANPIDRGDLGSTSEGESSRH